MRLVSALEGAGLFNDVTAITLDHVAIAAAGTGTFSVPVAAGELVLSGVVAVLVGLTLGWGASKLMGYLGDATLQTGLALLVPFASYVLAEELTGSGVLGVLTTALYLPSGRAVDADDVQGRLAAQTFWSIVGTLVTGVAFGLIGLEPHTIVGTMREYWKQLLPAALAVRAVVVIIRLLWLLPAAWLAQRLHRAGRDHIHRLRCSPGHARLPGAHPALARTAAERACRQRRRTGVGAAARRVRRQGGAAAAEGGRSWSRTYPKRSPRRWHAAPGTSGRGSRRRTSARDATPRSSARNATPRTRGASPG